MRARAVALAGGLICLGVFAVSSLAATTAQAGHAQSATLELPRGHATKRFAVSALASHTYDVTVTAPATAAVAVTMNTITGTRSTLGTLHDQGCRTTAGQALCVLHFARGDTPGGTWTVVVRKTSIPAARVRVSVVFNKN
jgi:hypothetical protein